MAKTWLRGIDPKLSRHSLNSLSLSLVFFIWSGIAGSYPKIPQQMEESRARDFSLSYHMMYYNIIGFVAHYVHIILYNITLYHTRLCNSILAVRAGPRKNAKMSRTQMLPRIRSDPGLTSFHRTGELPGSLSSRVYIRLSWEYSGLGGIYSKDEKPSFSTGQRLPAYKTSQ